MCLGGWALNPVEVRVVVNPVDRFYGAYIGTALGIFDEARKAMTIGTTEASAWMCSAWPTEIGSGKEGCENGNNLGDGNEYKYNEGATGQQAGACGIAGCLCCVRQKAQPQGTLLYKNFDVVIAYEQKDDEETDNVLSPQSIIKVSLFERRLRELPAWREFCQRTTPDHRRLCEPGISLVNFAIPTRVMPSGSAGSVLPEKLLYDGLGTEWLPSEAALHVLSLHNLTSVVLQEARTSEVNAHAQRMRSVFRFRMPCGMTNDSDATLQAAAERLKSEWEEFFRDELLPVLLTPEDTEENDEDWPLKVWFDSRENADEELLEEFLPDIRLVIDFCIGVAVVCTFLYTGNLFLAVCGCVIIALSALLSYSLFALTSDLAQLDIYSLLAVCMTVGIGTDILFTYRGLWLDSKDYVDMQATNAESEQILCTYASGVCATLKTNIILAAMFLTSIAISPLARFGKFMALYVVIQWAFLTVIFVPVCAINERFLKRYKRCRRSDRIKRTSCWALCVHSWRLIFAVGFCLACVAITVVALVQTEFDGEGVPLIPADHNQRNGREVLASFSSISSTLLELLTPSAFEEHICDDYDFSITSANSPPCNLLWCEVEAGLVQQDICECYEKVGVTDCPNGFTDIQRFIGLTESQINNSHLLKGRFDDGPNAAVARTAPPLIGSNWEMGRIALTRVTDVHSPGTGFPCGAQILCFCGVDSCQLQGEWTHVASFPVDRATNTSNDPSPVSVPAQRQTQRLSQVHVVMGISPLPQLRLEQGAFGKPWQFTGFNPAELWTQRLSLSICRRNPEALLVVSKTCWLEDFWLWMLRQDGRFPVPESMFQTLAFQFLGNMSLDRDALDYRKFLWVRDGQIQAWYYTFEVDATNISTASEVSAYRRQWQYFLEGQGWAVSEIWASPFQDGGDEEEPDGALIVLILVLLVVSLGTLIFTWEIRAASCALLSTVCTVGSLLFFDVILLDYEIGVTEIYIITLVAGYSSIFACRMAFAYTSPSAPHFGLPGTNLGEPKPAPQQQCTGFALNTAGPVILGSALFAAGVPLLMLLFCDLRFVRLSGAMALTGVVLGAGFALGPLPAALALFGHVPALTEVVGGPSRRQHQGDSQRDRHMTEGPVGHVTTSDIIFHGPLTVPDPSATAHENKSAVDDRTRETLAIHTQENIVCQVDDADNEDVSCHWTVPVLGGKAGPCC